MDRIAKAAGIIALCLISGCSRPHTYYLDAASGNDNNTGTSVGKPWKSVEKINGLRLKAGDRVLLKRGETFPGELRISGTGSPGKPVIVDAYGEGRKPCVSGTDSSLYAVYLYNPEYIVVRNLEVVNTGKSRLPGRTGVKVEVRNYGPARSVILQGLDIRDVNGSLVKNQGGGSGLLIVNGGDSIPSYFDGLTVEDCTIRRCARNGMIWSGYWGRTHWHPNLNVVVRNNLIEGVPGDGIVPIGCDGAVIEYNKMHNCPDLLPDTEAAAGIWPWSCDNTLIQFNEVSDHKAPWDGQGFDSDWNCRNTVIRYNYSHDNEGGFLLVCNDGGVRSPNSEGNQGTVVEYNVSIGDGVRTRPTRSGVFSPTVHFAGPAVDTEVRRNIIHVTPKPEGKVDRSIVSVTSWNGLPDNSRFVGNLFYSEEESCFKTDDSTDHRFNHNYYIGRLKDLPADSNARFHSPAYEKLVPLVQSGETIGLPYMRSVQLPAGELITVDKEGIENFFRSIEAGDAFSKDDNR